MELGVDRPLIVAVFGGNNVSDETLTLARGLGESITAHGAILLTGGDGQSHGQVKNEAIRGAPPGSSWIGVLKGTGGSPSYELRDGGIVLEPEIGDQRNFLEACMCDAAVVLEGGNGTVSELVSTICLGKPVLVIGDAWQTEWPGVHQLFSAEHLDPERKAELIRIALTKLDPAAGPLASLVRASITAGRLMCASECRYSASDQATPVADEWLRSLSVAPRAGYFPELEVFETLRQAYLRTLLPRSL